MGLCNSRRHSWFEFVCNMVCSTFFNRQESCCDRYVTSTSLKTCSYFISLQSALLHEGGFILVDIICSQRKRCKCSPLPQGEGLVLKVLLEYRKPCPISDQKCSNLLPHLRLKTHILYSIADRKWTQCIIFAHTTWGRIHKAVLMSRWILSIVSLTMGFVFQQYTCT